MCKYSETVLNKAIEWYCGSTKRTMEAVENKFGIPQSMFCTVLQERNISSNHPHCQRRVISSHSEIFISRLRLSAADKAKLPMEEMKAMYKSGASYDKVAKAYGVSQTFAMNFLKANGIKSRKPLFPLRSVGWIKNRRGEEICEAFSLF